MALLSGTGLSASTLVGAAAVIGVSIGGYFVVTGVNTAPADGVTMATAPDQPSSPVNTISAEASGEGGADISKPSLTLKPGTKFGSTDETGGADPDVDSAGTQMANLNPTGDGDPDFASDSDMTVSATVVGTSVTSSSVSGNVGGVSTDPAKVPAIALDTDSDTATNALRFDLVRVDKQGSTVIAGKAKPGQVVEVVVDGSPAAEVLADSGGNFVALFDLAASTDPQVISLRGQESDGTVVVSAQSAIVLGREVVKPPTPVVAEATPPAETQDVVVDAEPVTDTDTVETNVATNPAVPAPKETVEATPSVIIASSDGVKVLQPGQRDTAPEVMSNVTLDLISYDETGEVLLSGRSKIERHVRVYVDDRPIKTKTVDEDGFWELSLPEVDAGRYVLRVDELDGEGQVTSRFETPFQKEGAEDILRTASAGAMAVGATPAKLPTIQKITVQPGASLWKLASTNYGDGQLYMQILEANKEHIRNPDLIYPGQVFTIPD